MNIKSLLCPFLLLCLSIKGYGSPSHFSIKNQSRQGDFYFYWGWNRSAYTDSDLQLTGKDYNFSLGNVKAKDRQTPFSWNDYFGVRKLSIPQYNMRIGYFFDDHCEVSFGVDHMKYVVIEDQNVIINGEIGAANPEFQAQYVNDEIQLNDDFLLFEHTDGLNYLNLAFRRQDELLRYKKFGLGVCEGIEFGGLYPKTNAKLMGNTRHDEFNWAGYGISIVGGLTLKIYRYFFIQSEAKLGFIDLPNIRTTNNPSDRARQNFYFVQGNILFGFSVPLIKKK